MDEEAGWQRQVRHKLHIAVDHGSNIVRRATLTPANVADVDKGNELVMGDERAVYADQAYVGPRIRPWTERMCPTRCSPRSKNNG